MCIVIVYLVKGTKQQRKPKSWLEMLHEAEPASLHKLQLYSRSLEPAPLCRLKISRTYSVIH